jgi:hypothetical protein
MEDLTLGIVELVAIFSLHHPGEEMARVQVIVTVLRVVF